MTTDYINLFAALAQSAEVIAEQVMELDEKNHDEKGLTTATIMRDDYATLYDKLQKNDETLSHGEFAKLLVAAYIVSNNLEDKIKLYQSTLNGYKAEIIPKLQRIIDETHTDDEALKLANEIFKS